MSDMVDIPEAIIWAVEAGYRHFNTAVFVDDESQMGEAIDNVTRSGMVTRNDLFITTTVRKKYYINSKYFKQHHLDQKKT